MSGFSPMWIRVEPSMSGRSTGGAPGDQGAWCSMTASTRGQAVAAHALATTERHPPRMGRHGADRRTLCSTRRNVHPRHQHVGHSGPSRAGSRPQAGRSRPGGGRDSSRGCAVGTCTARARRGGAASMSLAMSPHGALRRDARFARRGQHQPGGPAAALNAARGCGGNQSRGPSAQQGAMRVDGLQLRRVIRARRHRSVQRRPCDAGARRRPGRTAPGIRRTRRGGV